MTLPRDEFNPPPSTQPPTSAAPIDLDLIDDTYLHAALQRVKSEIRDAERTLRFARWYTETLADQAELAARYRERYRRVTDALTALQQPLKVALADETLFPYEGGFGQDDYLCHPTSPPDVQAVPRIKQIVEGINAAERGFVETCEHVLQMAIMFDQPRRVDWHDGFDYEFTLELKLPPERSFYDTCVEGDPLCISTGPYGGTCDLQRLFDESHNLFSDPASPFHGDHHGYLVHCIIEHSSLPLELFPMIRSVTAGLKFDNVQDLWRSEPPAPRNQDDADVGDGDDAA